MLNMSDFSGGCRAAGESGWEWSGPLGACGQRPRLQGSVPVGGALSQVKSGPFQAATARGQLGTSLHASPYLPSVLGACWADEQGVTEEGPGSRSWFRLRWEPHTIGG